MTVVTFWAPMVVPGPPQADTPEDALGGVCKVSRRHDQMEWYRAQYNLGWAAAGRSGDSVAFDSGYTTEPWDDGYLDRAAGRAKWHLAWCLDHDNRPTACREA